MNFHPRTRIAAILQGTAPRPLGWTALALLAAIELGLLFKSSALTNQNSDTVQNVLEVEDILRGNILLRGWILALQNYYLTDNPFFLLTRLLFGRTLLAIYSAPFLIYVVLLLAASAIVLLAARDTRARMIGFGAVLFYLGTPSASGLGPRVFVGAVHIATLTFCILAWLALDAVERANSLRAARGWLVLYAASTFIALFSDPLAIVVFLIPTLVGLLFALPEPSRRPTQLTLIVLTLTLLAAARLALFMIKSLGGFTTVIGISTDFVSAGNLGNNAAGVLFGLINISGGYVFGRSLMNFATLIASLRMVGLGFMLSAMVVALRRGARSSEGWNLRFVLAVAMLIQLWACLFSAGFTGALDSSVLTGGAAGRYLVPVVLFGGILVALELPGMLRGMPTAASRWALSGLCATGVIVIALSFFSEKVRRLGEQPAIARASARTLAQWLLDHNLTHGVGGYWESMLIAVLADQKLVIGAVTLDNGQLKPYNWVTNRAWYRQRPQFVLYTSVNSFITAETITSTYGTPAAIHNVAGYEVALLSTSEP
jgi:hypothetical protein